MLHRVSYPDITTVPHALCNILALKSFVEVPLANGQKGRGVEYVADAGQGKHAGYLLYRNGKQLLNVPVAKAPPGTKHMAFFDGSGAVASIGPNATNSNESDLLSAITLMSMTVCDAQSRWPARANAPTLLGFGPWGGTFATTFRRK
jgi:hypothetical protein